MADFQMYYFDAEGRAEVCRLMLAASGQKWDDIRFTREEWPDHKKVAPFGQAPFLKYEGQCYGQSVAIENFLAREFGFAGKDSLETLRKDEVVQLVQDLMQLLIPVHFEQDETKKAELKEKLVKTDAPRFFGIFEKLLTDNKNCGHFVGQKLSHADLSVYSIITNMQNLLKSEIEGEYPAVKILLQKVEGYPAIKKYQDGKKAKQQAKA